MKYYKNKTTGNIIGIGNMREVIGSPNKQSVKYGRPNHSYTVVYDMICPNVILGNGITSYCITHQFLSNYKRIRKEVALKAYPDFKQYNHSDMVKEASVSGKTGLKILQAQRF